MDTDLNLVLMISKIGAVAVVRFLCDKWYDDRTVYNIRRELQSLLQTTDAKAIVLNLAGVQRVGAAGMGMLLRVQQKAKTQGIALWLSNVGAPIREHIHMDRLDPFFTIVDDEDDALAEFADVDQKEDSE